MATNYLDKTGLGTLWGKIKGLIPTKTSDLVNDSDFMSGMTILSYGHSTWNDFITAYKSNHVVYCRASTSSNPALGNQNRMAFMAYVNTALVDNESTPVWVEFQYYRSVKSHSNAQQGDQVYIYTLDATAGWTVTVREAYTRIVAGTGINASYSNGVLTISDSTVIPTKVSDLNNDAGYQTQAQVNALIAAAGDDDTTYAISISGNVITLTGSDGNTSTVTLPVYTGGVV